MDAGAPGAADEEQVRPVAFGVILPPTVGVGIFGTFLILFLGALYYARGFVLPLVLALLLTLTLSPLVRRLAHFGVPAVVSAIILVGVVGGSVATATAVLSGPLSEMAAQMPETVGKVRERLSFLRGPIATLNDAAHDIEAMLDGSDGDPGATAVVVSNGGGAVRWLIGTLADFGTTITATLMLAIFLLASMDSLRRKLVSVLPALSGKKRSLRVLHEIESDVAHYLVTVTAINAGLGLLFGLAMAAVGLGNAVVWGAAAGLLNFIPYAGPAVGVLLVAATSLATFDGLAEAATPPLIYLGLQLIEGWVVTPTILGRRLSLSPIAILTMLSLTTWMWGIVGTVIGVPLLVALKVFCDQFPSLAGVGVFLSGETEPVEEEDEHSVPAVGLSGNQSPYRGVEAVEAGSAASVRHASFSSPYNVKEQAMATKSASKTASKNGNDIGSLDDLFVHMLRDIYYAENKIVKSLPKMIDKSHDSTLKKGLQEHLEETRNHVSRLDTVFGQIGLKPKAIDCPAIDGIIKEADDLVGEIDDSDALDAAIVAAAQAVEHYEMTRYGTLIAWAKQLGYDDSAKVLAETLAEEKAADEKLTSVAESRVNAAAAA